MAIIANKVSFSEVDDEYQGQRLDNYLIRELKSVPKSWVYRVIRKGEVRINKKRAKPDTRLVAGDVVRIPPHHQYLESRTTVPEPLQKQLQQAILFENAWVIAINKPSGMAVHGGSGVSFGVIEILRAARPEEKFLELVHRLDRDTSGVLLIAKRKKALNELHDQLQQKSLTKIYHLVCEGEWPKRKNKVELPLRKNAVRSGERLVIVDEAGKYALTRFNRLSVGQQVSLVEAEPVTGRTHQIRVHALAAGHAILGDDKYASSEMLTKWKQKGCSRLCLHAHRIQFSLSTVSTPIEVIAPVPELFQQLLSADSKDDKGSD